MNDAVLTQRQVQELEKDLQPHSSNGQEQQQQMAEELALPGTQQGMKKGDQKNGAWQQAELAVLPVGGTADGDGNGGNMVFEVSIQIISTQDSPQQQQNQHDRKQELRQEEM